MEKSTVTETIKNLVPDAWVRLEGEDCNFTVVIVSDEFNEMKTITRQQKILAGFSEAILSGEIHALNIKAYTTEEWKNSQQLTAIEGL